MLAYFQNHFRVTFAVLLAVCSIIVLWFETYYVPALKLSYEMSFLVIVLFLVIAILLTIGVTIKIFGFNRFIKEVRKIDKETNPWGGK